MDTSETYIKMCGKAEEIQDLWQGLKGDFHAYQGDGMVDTLHTSFGTEWLRQHSIWLPRQDQLQEMLEYPDLGSILRDLREFWQRFPNHRITSMEQLWLAFVMKEKYNKVWDGQNWVKEE